jgi:hypothetical protein
VATLLTLIFLPALYVAWFRIEKPRPVSSQETDLAQSATALGVVPSAVELAKEAATGQRP